MAGSIQISSAAAVQVEAADGTRAEDLAKSDLWIFREGRRELSGAAFLHDLQQKLQSKDNLLDCLIQAGELEAALADLDATGATAAANLTDALAHQLCTGNRDCDLRLLGSSIQVPATISVSPPEGFTYYALHPLDFARVVETISPEHKHYAVIGIRSIGTTLSAVTAAALNARGGSAARITVRPSGHPYSRIARFLPEQESWIKEQRANSSRFLIIDEGPGRSGSTFLSVAEALCLAGVSEHQITIIGSRQFDPESLCAQDSADRWRRFRFVATTPSTSRFENWRYVGSGDWRKYFCEAEQHWPESWTQMERFKVLSPDGHELVKFEGMGRVGGEVRERAFVLARAGFSPQVADIGEGYLSYKLAHGVHLGKQDADSATLERIAHYCAFRGSHFVCARPCGFELEQMLVHNVEQEFGRELKLSAGRLSCAHAALADGRMQPYEWIAISNGQILKTDAISHGDNHFFPGPCSIAWDLAGTAIEWELGSEATEFLLNKFQQVSGTDVRQDFSLYMLAYSVFRLGFCKMARSTVAGTGEERRLDSAYWHYRAKAFSLLESVLMT